MKRYLIIDQDPPLVAYRQDHWPEDLYKSRLATEEDKSLPRLESLFKLKDGKPHPFPDGHLDPSFLSFGFYRRKLPEKDKSKTLFCADIPQIIQHILNHS